MRITALLVVGAVLATTPTPRAQIVLAPPTSSAVSPRPSALLVGDLDGDGALDVVIRREQASDESRVALGVGDGTFVETQSLAGTATDAVDLADLDGDGVLDVVLLEPGVEQRVGLRFGNGDGTFGPEVLLPGAHATPAVGTGDFDGDGDVDLAIGSSTNLLVGALGDVSVLLNDGDGAFPTEVDVTSMDSDVLAVGDIDGDGFDDLVFVSSDSGQSTVSVALSDTVGGFTVLPPCDDCTLTGGFPGGLELADVDADGDLDVLVLQTVAFGTGNVRPFDNDGSGGLVRKAIPPLSPVTWITTADLDGDGLAELLGSSTFSAEVDVAHNLGGSFAGPLFVTMGDGGGLGTGDFDGDGRIDVIRADSSADALDVALNATYASGGPLLDLGGQLGGTAGFPVQVVDGTLVAGSPLQVDVGTAPPGVGVWLVVGLSEIDAPFKGGALVPAPDLIVGPLPVDVAGSLSLVSTWPTGVPSGLPVAWQWWIVDSGGPAGFSATSAVRATSP